MSRPDGSANRPRQEKKQHAHPRIRQHQPGAGIIEAVKQSTNEIIEAELARMSPAPTAQEYERRIMLALESWPSALHAALRTGGITLLETKPADSRTFPGLQDCSDPGSFDGELDWVDESVDRTKHVRPSNDQIEELKRMSEARNTHA